MALFPLGGVLHGFPAAAYGKYASPQVPQGGTTLPREKIAHFWIGNLAVPFMKPRMGTI